MSNQISIVASRRGRAAIGRQILGSLAGAVAGTALVIAHLHSVDGSVAAPVIPPPAIAKPEVASDSGRRVIAVGQGTRHNRCDIPAVANDQSLVVEVDTGDPDTADFPSSYVSKLNVEGPLNYSEWWPGTRYGKIATAHLRQIRIGDVTWDDPEVNFYNDWDYSFGSDEVPLLGLAALKMHGVNVEFETGERCRLTVARADRRAGS